MFWPTCLIHSGSVKVKDVFAFISSEKFKKSSDIVTVGVLTCMNGVRVVVQQRFVGFHTLGFNGDCRG